MRSYFPEDMRLFPVRCTENQSFEVKKKAINACKALGLKFITALNVIVALYRKGKISKEDAETQIDVLDEFGWYNIRLIKKARQDIYV